MTKSTDSKYGLTQKRLRSRLSYDPVSGICLWTKTRSIAGNIQNGKGIYRRIGVDGRWYLAHRLVWFYVHGVWPKNELDHIDGNGLNNSLSNLRECNRVENCGNRGPSKNSTTKIKGIHWHKINKRWIVQIGGSKGKRYIGSFKTLTNAKTAYNNAAIEYFGEFARTV